MGGDPPPTAASASKREELSLGWLTESAVMPKKHKAIEGVSASSIVELKAQLYRTQEQAKRDKSSSSSSNLDQEFHRAKRRALPPDLFSIKNSGVDSRAKKEVHEEANQARHKITTTKLRRQEQEAARRGKLRQAYLRKQLEKLTASRRAAAGSNPANSEPS